MGRGRRAKGEVPSYNHHRGKGLAFVTIDKRQIYLGPYGSQESHRQYKAIIKAWAAAQEPGQPPKAPVTTIASLVARHSVFARQHYRRADGSVTSEVQDFKRSLRPLLALEYASMAPDEFGPRHLKAIREAWVSAGLARKTINKMTGRVRRLFRWGVEEELVEAATAGALAMVKDLSAGRTVAPDHEQIEPVPMRDLVGTIRQLHPILAAMVKVQYYAGPRPGEVCAMRGDEIDRQGIARIGKRVVRLGEGVWVFQPGQHKTLHAGIVSVYVLGRRVQAILAPFLATSPSGYLFSPAVVKADARAKQSEARRGAGNRKRRAALPKRAPGECYRVDSYAHAIEDACEHAGVDKWTPGRLRHNFLTRMDAAEGIQTASAAVNHRALSTTAIYLEKNLKAVAEATRRMG